MSKKQINDDVTAWKNVETGFLRIHKFDTAGESITIIIQETEHAVEKLVDDDGEPQKFYKCVDTGTGEEILIPQYGGLKFRLNKIFESDDYIKGLTEFKITYQSDKKLKGNRTVKNFLVQYR